MRDNTDNPILIDCFTEEYHSSFHLLVPEGESAYLFFPDGSRKFYGSGDHMIRLNRYHVLFRGQDRITQYRFDMSAQIPLALRDTVSLPELMMRYIAPEMKLYTPVEVCVDTELSVRISDQGRLLSFLLSCQEEDPTAVLDADLLAARLQEKLHYPLTESLCRRKQAADTALCHLSLLSEEVEVDLVEELCRLLDRLGLELVSLHISQINPTPAGMEAFHRHESQMLCRYNEARMDSLTHPGRTSPKRRKKASAASSLCPTPQLCLPPEFSGYGLVPAFA